MVVIMNPNATEKNIVALKNNIEEMGFGVTLSPGIKHTVLGIMGDTTHIDIGKLEANPNVDRVVRIQEPYKLASRKFHPNNTVIDVNGHKIGSDKLAIIAGPCSVEGHDQIIKIAQDAKKCGAEFMRGGAFKPRSSPYSFQGLELDGIELLMQARETSGLPIVSEIISTKYIDTFKANVDIIQVGARNMQNYDLLKELGKIKKPILLKRGPSSTIEEWLMSAEYILAGGNPNVILCERGIRTFETHTRNTLDISAIPAIKKLSHLPIIVDPSHSAGMSEMVEALSLAAIAAGADGLIIEVHNDPQNALCDGLQSINIPHFKSLMVKLEGIASFMGRKI